MSLSGVFQSMIYLKMTVVSSMLPEKMPFASRFGDIVTVFGVARLPRVWIERTCVSKTS